MALAKPISIGCFYFRTRGDARDMIRRVLNDSPWGTALDSDTHDFVLSLLGRHPRSSEKIGPGISHFTVGSDGKGDRCFHAHRMDGSSLHFSYVKCLAGKDDLRSMVLGALSRAIEDQIWAFRDAQLALGLQVCPYTEEIITKDHYHVDHPNPTFLEIHTQWFAVSGLAFKDIAISDGSGNEIGRSMVDSVQRQAWQEFHRTHAKLRLLSPKGNLSAAKIEANLRMRTEAIQ